MLADLLLLLGLGCIVAALFLVAIVAGLAGLGVVLVIVSLATSDGKGITWRS